MGEWEKFVEEVTKLYAKEVAKGDNRISEAPEPLTNPVSTSA